MDENRDPSWPGSEARDGGPETPACPAISLGDGCRRLASRFLEDTFRNFQLHGRKSSILAPPFSGRVIDVVPTTTTVLVPGGAYAAGVFVEVACYRVPLGRRAVIVGLGHSAESAAAFSDLEWQVQVDGGPVVPWDGVRIQLWQMVPPTPLYGGIGLREGQRVCILARSLSMADHFVLSRL